MASTDAGDAIVLFLFIAVFVTVNFVMFPYELYWVVQFMSNRHKVIIQKRRPSLLLAIILSAWASVLLRLVMSWILANVSGDVKTVFVVINKALVMPLIWFNSLGHSLRLYLIYYALRRNSIIASNEWKEVLNPSATSSSIQDTFYLESHQYLSAKYLLRYCLSYVGALIAIMVTNAYVTVLALRVIEYVMQVSIAILSIAVCIMIQRKLPENDDHIGLREELRYTTCVHMLFWIVIALFWVSLTFITDDFWNSVIFSMIVLLLRTLFMFLHLKLTRWPLTHFKSIIEGEHCENKMISLAHQNTLKSLEIAQTTLQRSDPDVEMVEPEFVSKASESIRMPSTPTHLEMDYVASGSSVQVIESGASGPQVLLRQTLKQMEFFDMFMRHCIKEYCTECLLSVTEMAQFQSKIIKENKTKNKIFDAPLFKIPAECPRSFIVWGEHGQAMALGISANQLYRKYIKEGSDFEINLRYSTRKRYREQFEKEDLNEDVQHLYHIFDDVIAEMMQLLMPAFQRFIQTEQYKVSSGRASMASTSATLLTPESQ